MTRLYVVLAVWLSAGGLTAFVMARRGFDWRAWTALGIVFGPFSVPLAWQDVRRALHLRPHVLHLGEPGAGDVDVLVGLDGSPESRQALARAVALLDGRIGRLTLAAVIDADAAAVGEREEAAAEIREQAAMYQDRGPSTVVLPGQPAEALSTYCRETSHDLIVVGRRGRGASRFLLGSVAIRLARDCEAPVLLGGAPAAAPEP